MAGKLTTKLNWRSAREAKYSMQDSNDEVMLDLQLSNHGNRPSA